MRYENLKKLFPYVDTIYDAFYQELLDSEAFSLYLKDDNEGRRLIETQKKHFIELPEEDEASFLKRFALLGRAYYDAEIPFEAFLSGTKLLNQRFVASIIGEALDTDLILTVNDYYTRSAEAMAKGCLDACIEAEKKEIDRQMVTVDSNMSNPRARELLRMHYDWLEELFTAVEEESPARLEVQDFKASGLYEVIEKSVQECERLETEQVEEAIRIYTQVFDTARRLFYFIGRGNYTEALVLFVKLLEIYRFNLMFSNMVNAMSAFKAQRRLVIKTALSEEDPQKGPIDRVKLEDLLDRFIYDAREAGTTISAVLMDVDDFNQINDLYGNEKGNDVLTTLLGLLREQLRPNDIIVRFSGEEFIVLSLDMELGNAVLLAEKLRKAIKAHDFGTVDRVTASIGVSILKERDDAASLIERADQNMYRSKFGGKNRVSY